MTAIRKLPLPAPVSIRVNIESGDLVPMRFEPLLRWECKANSATNSLKWTNTFAPNCSYSLVSSFSGIFRSYFYLFWSGLSLPYFSNGFKVTQKTLTDAFIAFLISSSCLNFLPSLSNFTQFLFYKRRGAPSFGCTPSSGTFFHEWNTSVSHSHPGV